MQQNKQQEIKTEQESTQTQKVKQTIDTNFIECKNPQAKDKHADKVLEDFEKDYGDIDKVINLINKEESKLEKPQEEPQQQKEQEQEEPNIDKQKNELERAMDSILNARGFIDIIKALYAIEKAMYELKIASKKPDPQQVQEEIKKNKDKPLTMDFLKESIQKLREGKNKIVEYSKNIKLERAFAKELGKDIQMHDLVTDKEAKSAYEKRIDKKLVEAKDKFPNLQENFPKMLKAATEIIKPPLQELGKTAIRTMAVGAGLSL
ncbi:Uncharacterised protein [Helicobacter fennelliae]|uniref:Uncharacterized protein n=1 Tax=Helicobacter fennelliae TaxID=215 RepID=A0A2X3E1Q0_9HELI|nr:hypothetical protein [Helicobacter fennelliae]SQC36278.1 Uncharacterised protein [Helicobacter fennelliae]